MSAIIEIDKAGRIVVPKKLRDALHLTPGTRLIVERSGDMLTLVPNTIEAKLVIENGAPLIFPADPSNVPILTNEMVSELVAQGRQERERRFLGFDEESTEGLNEAIR
jgi:AbrB family looped-hinge helix DNA binding protein